MKVALLTKSGPQRFNLLFRTCGEPQWVFLPPCEKPVKGVAHARARVRGYPFLANPYNWAQAGPIPPKRRQSHETRRSKYAGIHYRRSFGYLFPRGHQARPEGIRHVCDARRCAPGPSMDWQAWSTKCELCWRATRDDVRHVPAAPPKSP